MTSLSLGWVAPATISQTVVTTSGQAYDLNFFMAAEIFGGSALRTMDVLWNGGCSKTLDAFQDRSIVGVHVRADLPT